MDTATEKVINKGGAEYIASKIQEAIENETRTAIISGNWEIDKEIRLPSNFTLIMNDCYLRLADGCYTNVFVNQNHDTDTGRTIDGTDRNISIIGRGMAILDGGKYNGLSEKTSSKDGLPPIWKNNLILFTNVDGFKVEGITCRNQRWWALNFVYCSNGYVGNIDFRGNDTAVDENGNEYHGLLQEKYSEVLAKNCDGIDLRQGCHDIVIENITGFVEDDSVALTCVEGRLEKDFAVKGLTSDICNITVRNIRTAAFCSNVRLLSKGKDFKLHDILVDGVYDMAIESPHLDYGIYAVNLGDPRFFSSTPPTDDDVYNITLRNICGKGVATVALAGGFKNLVMYGVEAHNGAKLILDRR